MANRKNPSRSSKSRIAKALAIMDEPIEGRRKARGCSIHDSTNRRLGTVFGTAAEEAQRQEYKERMADGAFYDPFCV